MNHIEFLRSQTELSGKSVIDIGAGTGAFARQLLKSGVAAVTGVEVDLSQIEAILADLPREITMMHGVGEGLPVESDSYDLACFIQSYHHIPVEHHAKALEEAHRVLKCQGRLHVAEPYADGSLFEVLKYVDDETVVRKASIKFLNGITETHGFRLISRQNYQMELIYKDFETLLNYVVFVDPERSRKLHEVRGDMERAFYDAAEQIEGRYRFIHPCVGFHFEKV